MRINCRTDLPCLTNSILVFDSLSKIYQTATKRSNTILTFDLENVSNGDANLSAVCASIGFVLGKSGNKLDIGPLKYGYNKIRISNDLFGFRVSSYAFIRQTFCLGGTDVKIIKPGDLLAFNDYLIHHVIRKDWKKDIPIHYSLDAKNFLRRLYSNCSEHSGTIDPIFVSSSFKNNVLSFTIADCGDGFLKGVNSVDDEVITENQAIKWTMNGKSIKHQGSYGLLKELGDYCWFNSGKLIVVSGNASIEYKEDGEHECKKLSTPIRGSIVIFSLKVVMPKFSEE